MQTISKLQEYTFDDIRKKLPQLTVDQENKANKWVEACNRIDSITARIALQLLLYFNEVKQEKLDQIFIHRSGDLRHSLYIAPEKQTIHLLSGINEKIHKGGNKTGHSIISIENDKVTYSFKLSNQYRGIKLDEYNKIKSIRSTRIYPNEIETALSYSGKPGFPILKAAYSRMKGKSVSLSKGNGLAGKVSYTKTSLIFEAYNDTLTNCNITCSIQEKVLIFQQIAEAVQQLHTAGLVHGDIDGTNILIARDEKNRIYKAALTDFGFIKKANHPIPSLKECKSQPDILHNARISNYSPESVCHLYEQDLKWTQDKAQFCRKANDIYAFGIAMFTFFRKYEPSWCKELDDLFKSKEITSSTAIWQRVRTYQSNIKKNITELSKTGNKAEDRLLLIAFKMLDPVLVDRLTIDQVVEELKKITII